MYSSMGYYKRVWTNALRRYRLRLTAGSERLMGFLVQTAIVFGILYFQPWIGDLGDEAKLAGAGVVAILASAALSFLWDLLASPKEIHEQLQAEFKSYSDALGYHANTAEAQDQLIALFREGEAIYVGESDYAKWRDGMLEWHERVLNALKIAFDPSIVFRYENARGQATRSKWIEITDAQQPDRAHYNALFSGWLYELENIAKHGHPDGTNWVKIRELNANRVAPDSLKALNEKNGGKLTA